MRGLYRTTAMASSEPEFRLAVAEDEWDALSPMVAPPRVPEISFQAPRRAIILIALAGILGVVIGMTLGSSTQARDHCDDEYSPLDCSQ